MNNSSLHGTLQEDVYMVQPPGFVDAQHPAHVCKLRKSMYGLKQEPRAWYQELSFCLVGLRFVNSKMDPSLLIYQQAGVTGYFIVYVDDLILIGNCSQFLSQVIAKLGANFSLKDLRHLNYFIGVEVVPTSKGLFLSQHKYIRDLLQRFQMDGAKAM